MIALQLRGIDTKDVEYTGALLTICCEVRRINVFDLYEPTWRHPEWSTACLRLQTKQGAAEGEHEMADQCTRCGGLDRDRAGNHHPFLPE